MEAKIDWKHFKVNGMWFDAAIDYAHELHAYEHCGVNIPEGTIPVELYNCDIDWGINMIYPKAYNGDVRDEDIIQGIKDWIASEPAEMKYPEFPDDWDEE